MITLSNIQLRRGQKVLLDDAELVVHPGQHIGIIGANGSGKSTLFKLLMGQVTPDAGDLFIPSNWRVAHMAQELANSENSALYIVKTQQQTHQARLSCTAAPNNANFFAGGNG